MIYFTLVATLWRAASKNWNDMYHYEECCLLPWVVYVSQGFPVILMLDRLHFLEEFLLSCGTCWWNILTLSYEQRRCHSSVTSDWWTIYVGEFSVTGWTALSRHLYCCDVRCYCVNDCWWNIFRYPSIIFFVCNLLDEHSSSLHSFWRWRLPHQDCCWDFES